MTIKKKFDSLNETFNISSEPISMESDQSAIDLEKDYLYARATITNIIQKGSEALDNILELAQETDSARAYEVVGQLIDKMTTSTEKLLDLHKKVKDIKDSDTNTPTNVTNNAMFFGSTTEAIKMIKAQLKEIGEINDSDK
jgi:dTDP-D-glucose 4,6-dehydratase